MPVTSLDHVGIAGPSLDALAVQYEALGFTLTPFAQHHAPAADGVVHPIGTGNRCAMLRQGYLELIAVVDPALPSNTLDRFLARYAGLHIVAFGIADAATELARLKADGVPIPGVAWLERPVGTPSGTATARFARLPLPDAPEGRVQLIEHLTPELLWQPHLLEHPNHAVSLDEVIIATADPAEATTRLARLAATTPSDCEGGFVVGLGAGQMRIVSPEAAMAALPGIAVPCLPFIAGLRIGTDDGAAAISTIAAKRGSRHAGGFLVGPAHGGGAALLFT